MFSPCFVLFGGMCPFKFAIIVTGKREFGCFALTVFLLHLYLVTVSILWLFLMMLWASLQCVFVAFPDHSHLVFWFFLGGFLQQLSAEDTNRHRVNSLQG